jgi:hypothetical protein
MAGILRGCLGLAFLFAFAAAGHAQAPGWIADPKTGCKVWAARTGPSASVDWTGSCKDGLADGRGTVIWINGNKYEGDLKDGKYQGKGVFTFVAGYRYDGEFKDGKPNGQGMFTRPDGQVFRGVWNNGCFRQGNRWAAVIAAPLDCGSAPIIEPGKR